MGCVKWWHGMQLVDTKEMLRSAGVVKLDLYAFGNVDTTSSGM